LQFIAFLFRISGYRDANACRCSGRPDENGRFLSVYCRGPLVGYEVICSHNKAKFSHCPYIDKMIEGRSESMIEV